MPAEIDIPEELSEKILAFVERETGRDALLSPDDEAMVRKLLATDSAAQALADDFRDVDTGLKAMFQAFGNMPVSEELMQRIHTQDQAVEAKEKEAATNKVVAFPEATKPRTRSYAALAVAASLALVIAGGGFFFQFDARKDLEQTVAELEAERSVQQGRIEGLESEAGSQQDLLAAAVDARRNAVAAFSAASGDIARLQVELATISAARGNAETALATATATLTDLRETEAELIQQMATLEDEAEQATVQGATERNALQSRLADVETELAAVAEGQRGAKAELLEANSAIGELIGEGAALNQKVVVLEARTETLTADVAAREQQLEQSQTALTRSRRQAAELATERETLAAVVDRGGQEIEQIQAALAALEQRSNELAIERDTLAATVDDARQGFALAQAQLASAQQQNNAFQTSLETLRAQTGWLGQVAGYHIGYAGKPREVEEKNGEALSKWLSSELGQEITIPRGQDLPMEGGLTFVGGRVLPTIDGISVGQIAYHDSEGRLTAFCLKRNPTGVADEELKRKQFFGRLQMIHWQDEAFQYVVVGFAGHETLEPVAAWLQDNYRGEI